MRTRNALPPHAHPGEHLRLDYMPAYGISVQQLAKLLRLEDWRRVDRLLRGEQSMTADTALRLGKLFGTTPEYWMDLQAQHDLAKRAPTMAMLLSKIETLPPLPGKEP